MIRLFHTFNFLLDICSVRNGGCDMNAECSFDANADRVSCTCKRGYMNVGNETKVVCAGKKASCQHLFEDR